MEKLKLKFSRSERYMNYTLVSFGSITLGLLIFLVVTGIKSNVNEFVKFIILDIAIMFVNFGFVVAVFGLMRVGKWLSIEQDESQKKDEIIKNQEIQIEKMRKDNRFSEKTLDELHEKQAELLLDHVNSIGKQGKK